MLNKLFARQAIYNPDLDVVAYYFTLDKDSTFEQQEQLESLATGYPLMVTKKHPQTMLNFSNTLRASFYNEDNAESHHQAVIIDLETSEINKVVELAKNLLQNKTAVLVMNILQWKDFYQLKDAGVTYFHGPFITQPGDKSNENISANNLVVMELLNQLQNPDIQIEKLEELISRDVALSYRLLKYINSAAFALQREVDSVRHAIIMLGLNTIINLANLMLMSNIENKPKDLFMLAMTRARMCENLSQLVDKDRKEVYFTAGLFSVIDALTDKPMEDTVNSLPLIPEIKSALLSHEGNIGKVLSCCIQLEQGVDTQCLDLSNDIVEKAYLDAIEWTNQASYLVKKTEEESK